MPQDAVQPTAVADDQPGQDGPRFGRLSPAPGSTPAQTRLEGHFGLRIPAPPAPPAAPPEAAEQPVLPFDWTKVFVGPNGTYYDERWRSMEWRGRSRSWNWAAALTLGAWLAYRRLYRLAALYLAWLGVVVLMILHHVFLPLTAAAQVCVVITLGLFGNRLYQVSFRRAAMAVAQQHQDYGARVAALAGRGGVDRRAAFAWSLAAIGLAALLVGLHP
jgi:Protein of unknown function (DUF2628)